METAPRTLHIDLWGINYHPEPIGIAVYNTQLSEYLAKKGHEMRATTGFPYYPQWRKLQPGVVATENMNNVLVRRNWLYVPHKVSTRRRVLHEFSFAVTSFFRQLFSRRADVYVVVSPPLLLGLCAIIISAVKCAPFVFYVQDLQPDAAIALGMIKQGWLLKLLLWMEATIYKEAATILVISDGMKDTVAAKGVPQEKIVTLPNWTSDADKVPAHTPNSWKRQHGLSEQSTLISYCGNIGVKQGLESVVEAAYMLSKHQDLHVAICGDGADKDRLQELVDARNLKNVSMLPLLESDDYWALLQDSDACLVTLKPGTGASFLPSKLLNILLAGKPVITNADAGSALHAAVIDGKFGCTASGDAESLAECMRTFLDSSTAHQQMGENAREYVKRFDKAQILDGLSDLLIRICESPVVPRQVGR